MLRIIAGEYRSRSLLVPPDERTSRPYAQRVKEAVFNRLRGWFEGARVLDLFAGVGTMGLEAVSRGAAQVVMIERDRRIAGLLRRNVEALGCGDRATVVEADALGAGALLRAPRPVDVVFVDPPYALMRDDAGRARVLAQIARCRPLLADPGFVVLRSPLDPERTDHAVDGLDGPEAYKYGLEMWVLLFAPPVDDADGPR